VVVIGGGAAGRNASMWLATRGKRVALIEKTALGGECALSRCSLIDFLAHQALNMELFKEYGIEPPTFKQIKDVYIRKRDVILRKIQQETEKSGVEVIYGTAKIIDGNSIRIGNSEISGEYILIATGSRPCVPPVEGIDLKGVYTYKEIIQIDKIPERLVVVGGGTTGASYAYIFQVFGSDVVIIEQQEFLRELDSDIRAILMDEYKRKGIKILENSNLKQIKGGKRVEEVVIQLKDETIELKADGLIFSTGLVPNSELAKGIVDIGRNSEIIVDKMMKTSNETIYAAGDVVGPPYLTPVARLEGLTAAQNIAGKNVTMDYSYIPQNVFAMYNVSYIDESRGNEHEFLFLSGRGDHFILPSREILLCLNRDRIGRLIKLKYDPVSLEIRAIYIVNFSEKSNVQYLAHMMKSGLTLKELANIIEIYPQNDWLPQTARKVCEAYEMGNNRHY